MSKKEIVSVEQAQVISLSERDSNKLCADCKEHKSKPCKPSYSIVIDILLLREVDILLLARY